MRHFVFAKVTVLALVLFALTLSGYSASPQTEGDRNSQTSNSKNANTPQAGPGRNQDAGNSVQADAWADLVQINLNEVEVGKMASTKATNPRVKDFANMMIKDHTDAFKKLRPGGQPSDVRPNAKQQQTLDRLLKLTGAEFDREYIAAMVSGHQEAIKFLEQHSGSNGSDYYAPRYRDPRDQNKDADGSKDRGRGQSEVTSNTTGSEDLRKIAQELLPTVRHHLELAQAIQKELGRNSGAHADRESLPTNIPSDNEGRPKQAPKPAQK